ncbi:hypothetical protein CLF_103194 [Clonorchis sinensis]|uniref:Uncharacterized protein n=1 Tax=Clonorchis sinensis TaxID=79923 RepID=G7Y9A9_CLOSI|nr:hypothetical protein CLF_103194 [Clonorchis sinensis]
MKKWLNDSLAKHRLERRAEYFDEQFIRITTKQTLRIFHTGGWDVDLNRPSEEKESHEPSAQKREKARIPDNMYPDLIREGGEILVIHLIRLIDVIWGTKAVSVKQRSPIKTFTLLKVLYANYRRRVKVYGKRSAEFVT